MIFWCDKRAHSYSFIIWWASLIFLWTTSLLFFCLFCLCTFYTHSVMLWPVNLTLIKITYVASCCGWCRWFVALCDLFDWVLDITHSNLHDMTCNARYCVTGNHFDRRVHLRIHSLLIIFEKWIRNMYWCASFLLLNCWLDVSWFSPVNWAPQLMQKRQSLGTSSLQSLQITNVSLFSMLEWLATDCLGTYNTAKDNRYCLSINYYINIVSQAGRLSSRKISACARGLR